MPPTPASLTYLARRLARQESQVQRLRRAYENRLDSLKSRREQLAEKLREIDEQIHAVAPESPEVSEGPAPAEEPEPTGKRAKRGTLPALIVKMLNKAGEPLTIKQISHEVRRRRFPTTSNNIPRLVQTRVYDLVRKEILAPAGDRSGYVLVGGASSPGPQASDDGQVRTKKKRRAKAKTSRKKGGGQPSLREVLTKILSQAKQPLGGGELAQKVLQTGYKSDSKSFGNVVSVSLANMKDSIEHVPGEGYRLRK